MELGVIFAIIGGGAFLIAFLALAFLGPFLGKTNGSVQQLRWVLALFSLFLHSAVYGSIALGQPYVDRPDDDNASGTKSVLWAIPALWTVTHPLLVGVLTLGLFHSLGARIAPMVLALAEFACLLAGVFLFDFNLWYWFGWAGGMLLLFSIALMLVDHMDVLAGLFSCQRNARGKWYGVWWRVAVIVAFILYHLIWSLDAYAGEIISYNVSLTLEVILDIIVHIIVAFLIWWFVPAAEYEPDAALLGNGADGNYAGDGQSAPQQQITSSISTTLSKRNNAAKPTNNAVSSSGSTYRL